MQHVTKLSQRNYKNHSKFQNLSLIGFYTFAFCGNFELYLFFLTFSVTQALAMSNADASSSAVPFLVDENQQGLRSQLNEIEANHLTYNDSRTSKTSFFKTFFNGVNALSGSSSKLLLKTIKIS